MYKLVDEYLKKPSSILNGGEVQKVNDLSFLDQSIGMIDALKEVHEKADVFTIKSNGKNYLFFAFESTGRGFLTTKEFFDESQELHEVHKSIAVSLGEIVDIHHQNLESMQPLLNVFPSGKDIIGLGAFEEDYMQKCQAEGIKENQELKTLTTLAFEANGNLTQYSADGTIYLYLNDHSPDRKYIQSLPGTPEDTFYSSSPGNILDWSNAFIRSFM